MMGWRFGDGKYKNLPSPPPIIAPTVMAIHADMMSSLCHPSDDNADR
jgi:hypothetical protein